MPSFRVSVNRPLDLERFTDRWALGALFAFGAAGYWRGGWPEAVQSGLASYLGWAISREIDPDHPGSANLASLAGGFAALALHADIGVMFVMLVVVKVMVAGSGLSPARWEAGLLGAAALVFAGSQPGWWAAMAMAAALFLDTAIHPFAPQNHRYIASAVAMGGSVVYLLIADVRPWWWAQVAAVAAGGLVMTYLNLNLHHRSRLSLLIVGIPAMARVTDDLVGGSLEGGPWWEYCLLVAGSALAVTLCFLRTEVHSPTDHTAHSISSERVGLARCLVAALVIFSWASAFEGSLLGAMEPTAPLWAVLCIVGTRELWERTGWGLGRKRP